MKSTILRAACLLTILAATFGPAAVVRGQLIYMTLDENGAGAPHLNTFSPQANVVPVLPFPVGYTIAAEPLSGITTLRYTLPHSGQAAGDLFLTDPTTSLTSDVIRFDGLGNVYFFSLKEPWQVSFSLADVDALPSLQANRLAQVEVVPQNFIGNLFNPALGQPGYDPFYGGGLGYNIISEVPEPSAPVLGGLGLMLLAARGSRCARR
jgi:hypothetical protein